ncbi:MAG TPA: NAD(P)/FAD-dependent oxidoreductase [Acidimicrobiales bacterium]
MSTPAAPAGDSRHHVVIIGCGFGGLFAVRALRHKPVRVTIIDRTNHHLFQPLLYQVATGILSEGQIAPAIRDVLRNYENVRVVLGAVQTLDLEAKEVHVDEFGEELTIPYDSLIVAGGAATSYFGHDEFEKCASGLKSLDDALALRGEIFGAFELAERETDAAKRKRLMTFVVVGGGPSGVELAGQLKELSRRALRRNYRRIDPRDTRVVLVEGTDRLLASMGTRVSRLTAKKLTRMGVEIHLDTMVSGMDGDTVEVTTSDGEKKTFPAATKIWAAGTRAAGIGGLLHEASEVELDKAGRVKVEGDCSIPGHPEVFAVGDLMALDGLPGVAEVAMQSGAHAAHTIARRLEGKPTKKFKYHDLGTLAVISRFTAVAHIGPFQLGGFIGWLLWLVVHITFLTGFKNRFGALARWGVSFVGHGRYERALTGRWVAHAGPPGDTA